MRKLEVGAFVSRVRGTAEIELDPLSWAEPRMKIRRRVLTTGEDMETIATTKTPSAGVTPEGRAEQTYVPCQRKNVYETWVSTA